MSIKKGRGEKGDHYGGHSQVGLELSGDEPGGEGVGRLSRFVPLRPRPLVLKERGRGMDGKRRLIYKGNEELE